MTAPRQNKLEQRKAEFKAEKNAMKAALKGHALLQQGKSDEALVYLKRAESWIAKMGEAKRSEWRQRELSGEVSRTSRPKRRTSKRSARKSP